MLTLSKKLSSFSLKPSIGTTYSSPVYKAYPKIITVTNRYRGNRKNTRDDDDEDDDFDDLQHDGSEMSDEFMVENKNLEEPSKSRKQVAEEKKQAKAVADARRDRSDKKLEQIFDKETLERPGEEAAKKFEPTFKDNLTDSVYVDYIATKLANQSNPRMHPKTGHYYLPDELIPTKRPPTNLDDIMEQDYTPKNCMFCFQKKKGTYTMNAMNVPLLARFLNPHGKILPREASGSCAKHQRKLAHTIKKAINMGFFSYKSSQFQIRAPYLPENIVTFAGPSVSSVALGGAEVADILRPSEAEIAARESLPDLSDDDDLAVSANVPIKEKDKGKEPKAAKK